MSEFDPSMIAEHDQRRSEYVRRLHLVDQPPEQGAELTVPRSLVQFWDNTRAIPADVRECMDSWRPLKKQGFSLLLFDDDTARKFIGDHFSARHLEAFGRCEHPAMRSDYFRLCFMMSNGGFYVDADDVYQGGDCDHWFHGNRLKLQPLCYDISTDSMVESKEFLARPAESSDRVYYANNNPLIAPPNHPIIAAALARATRVLLNHVGKMRDIQSLTGPGNLTISLVRYAIGRKVDQDLGFAFLTDWDALAVSRWPLGYRNDQRNWRLWVDSDA